MGGKAPVKTASFATAWTTWALEHIPHPEKTLAEMEDRRLRYRIREPDYEMCPEPDGDAAASLDSFKAFLWFRARGDECLNCGSPRQELWQSRNPTFFRVHE